MAGHLKTHIGLGEETLRAHIATGYVIQAHDRIAPLPVATLPVRRK